MGSVRTSGTREVERAHNMESHQAKLCKGVFLDIGGLFNWRASLIGWCALKAQMTRRCKPGEESPDELDRGERAAEEKDFPNLIKLPRRDVLPTADSAALRVVASLPL